MESDLKTLSRRNLFCKYADDTNFFVPGNSDIGFNEEFINIKNWARAKVEAFVGEPEQKSPLGKIPTSSYDVIMTSSYE